jgi:hypothetical protein
MRIRTIKPEFWANEKMGRLPDFARLLAIGLLNYADDYGYFWANPLMIRGALLPFEEDSSKVLKGLAQLESEGYISLGKTADGRSCGKVINFTKHQRVDKPKDSEIEPIAIFQDNSKNDIGSISDELPLEGKGKEGKGISRPEPSGSDGEESSQQENTEGQRFVLWFIELLQVTGAEPKLTPAVKSNWADCYDKMVRIDGRTKEQIAAVCRWARNDEFWRKNFLSPMKLREKKDGVSYFDVFVAKMGDGRGFKQAEPRPDIYTEPPDWRERFARKWPDIPVPATWAELSSTARNDLIRKT